MPDRRVGINRLNRALYGANTSDDMGDCGVEECPPEGAVGHCPARFALDSGQKKARTRFHQASSCSKPSGKRGRSATFTDAAIQACQTLKALFGLPLRQTTGLVASLLELAGHDWAVPDFSTLSRRQKGLNVALP